MSDAARMKLLSTRARAELWRLQSAMRVATKERDRALRMLTSSRAALSNGAQRDICMEFACADQEYRYALTGLARFCERHSAATEGVSREVPGDYRHDKETEVR